MTSENHTHEVENDFADEFDSPSENHRMAAHHFSEAAKECPSSNGLRQMG